ncbi:MAG: GTP 3',8-cyclase MoaA [bacterium]
MNTQLQDPFKRTIDYVRLSVTDRCDLRCYYCMPKGFNDFTAPESWLTFDEITRVIAAFGRLGVSQIRLTGGEPLVRHGLPDLAARLTQLDGIKDLSLSTNAVKLKKHARALKQGGVSRLNVSLDTLKPELFSSITCGKLSKVLDGLEAAKQAGFFPIKINMVVMRGVNDHEVNDMVEFCIKHNFTLRFIETMPMGDTGRNALNQYIPLSEVRAQLEKDLTLITDTSIRGAGPASYVRVAGTELRIGFITPMSQHFCATCNRVRLSTDGTLYMCLGQENNYPLRPMLRDHCTDTELENAIISAIALKPQQHEFTTRPDQIIRTMSVTGG